MKVKVDSHPDSIRFSGRRRKVATIAGALLLAIPLSLAAAAPAQAASCTGVPSAGNAPSWGKPYIGTAWIGAGSVGNPDPYGLFGCPNPGGRNHYGVDYDKSEANFNILAVADGKVEDRFNDEACHGKTLVLRHGSGTGVRFSIYAHLSTLYYTVGDTVSKGAHIAESGNTGGCTTADHPHLAMSSHWDQSSDAGRWSTVQVFDPRAFLKARGVAVE